MPSFIAILDRAHLENALFLKSFARALSKHGSRKGIILHGDSEYTERIIQNGVMREDAQIRAAKDLNRRLIGLLADHGVSAIGIHAYQRELLTVKGNTIKVNAEEIQRLSPIPQLVISNLIEKNGKLAAVELTLIAAAFKEILPDSEILVFSLSESDGIFVENDNNISELNALSEEQKRKLVPEEFRNFNEKAILTTPEILEYWPNF